MCVLLVDRPLYGRKADIKHTTMSNTHYSRVSVEKKQETETYLIKALPKGANFKQSGSYDEIEASYLSVEGVGFGCDYAEFSEYKTTITLEQKTEGGSVDLRFHTED